MLSKVLGWNYQKVGEYLAWCKPRIEAIRNGDQSEDALYWHKEFLATLNRRINKKACLFVTNANWRKLSQDWQRTARNDAQAINSIGTTRRRVYSTEITTDNWRIRFGNLYARKND